MRARCAVYNYVHNEYIRDPLTQRQADSRTHTVTGGEAILIPQPLLLPLMYLSTCCEWEGSQASSIKPNRTLRRYLYLWLAIRRLLLQPHPPPPALAHDIVCRYILLSRSTHIFPHIVWPVCICACVVLLLLFLFGRRGTITYVHVYNHNQTDCRGVRTYFVCRAVSPLVPINCSLLTIIISSASATSPSSLWIIIAVTVIQPAAAAESQCPLQWVVIDIIIIGHQPRSWPIAAAQHTHKSINTPVVLLVRLNLD